MYDFANTIFSMNVITLYFALWVTVDMKGEDIYYSWALSGSMLLAALSAPIIGAISDRLGRRIPFLAVFTIISCVFTALISIVSTLIIGLLVFVVANYCYQLADVFYNSLLPRVSEYKNTGRISGYGVSLGYLGTIAGLILIGPFALHYGRQMAFLPTGILFLLFALPCLIFVKDSRVREDHHVGAKPGFRPKQNVTNAVIIGVTKIKHTLCDIRNYPNLVRFLIAAFIALNAINTVFIFMSVYTKKVMGFTDKEILIFYIASSLFAILGAFSIGFITDKFGAKKTFVGVLCLWCVVMLLAVLSVNRWVFLIIGPLVGISLGGTWTSARALTVDLAPPHMVGEIFGFYGLVGKTASIVGPIIWGVCVWTFGFLGIMKYRLAVIALLIFLICGVVILRKVPNKLSFK